VDSASAEVLTVESPARRTPVASIPRVGKEDVDRAVQAAQRASLGGVAGELKGETIPLGEHPGATPAASQSASSARSSPGHVSGAAVAGRVGSHVGPREIGASSADTGDHRRHSVNQPLAIPQYRLGARETKSHAFHLSKICIMSKSSADLIAGWQVERAVLQQKIVGLRTGALGLSLTDSQREAAISDQMQAAADFDSLITDFSRCEIFSIKCEPAKTSREPIVRRRFAANVHSGVASVAV